MKVIEKIEGSQDVEECWRVVRGGIRQVLEFGAGKKKTRPEEDEEMKEMRKELEKLKKEKRKSHVEQKRFKILKNRIGKRRMRDRILDVVGVGAETASSIGSR